MSVNFSIQWPPGLRITNQARETLGTLSSLSVDILLLIFRKLDHKSLAQVASANHLCRRIIVSGTKWGTHVRMFCVFQAALTRTISYREGRSFHCDFRKHRCIFRDKNGDQETISAVRPLPLPSRIFFSYALTQTALVCILSDKQTCGRLDIDPVNCTLAFSSLPLFLLSLPDIATILDPFPCLDQIELLKGDRIEEEVHLVLRVCKGREVSGHFLAYAINLESSSSCYLGTLKSYYRTKGVGVQVEKIERITVSNGMHVDQFMDFRQQDEMDRIWTVIGFSGNWLVLGSFSNLYSSHPQEQNLNYRFDFLDRTNFRKEGCCDLRYNFFSSIASRCWIDYRDNLRLFLAHPTSILMVGNHYIRLTREAQETVHKFNKITHFSCHLLQDSEVAIRLEGEDEMKEKISLSAVVDPLALSIGLSPRFPSFHRISPYSYPIHKRTVLATAERIFTSIEMPKTFEYAP